MTPLLTHKETITYEGIDFTITGETFSNPIYPNQDIPLHSRLVVHYAGNGIRVGEVGFADEWNEDILKDMVSKAVNDPSLVISKPMVDIIKKSKDYSNGTSKNN